MTFALQTRDNKVLNGRILLRQPVSGFRSGSDAVLLAASAHPSSGGHVVDLGCGTGSAMLCVASRRPDIRFTGVEMDAQTADLARFNVRRNGFAEAGAVLTGNVTDLGSLQGLADTVIANPPYFTEAHHRRSPDAARNRARAETTASLHDWILTATSLLNDDGEAVFILRSERIEEAIAALPMEWQATILPVVGAPEKPAKRSLLRFARRALPVSARPINLHHPGGAETTLATAVFRHAAPIFWR